MDFTPSSEHPPFQERKLMKREPLSPISNELLEFGTNPSKFFKESSFSDTCVDWMDDFKTKMNHGSTDYMCDFWDEDFSYLNELVTTDPLSPLPTDARKIENGPLSKMHQENSETHEKKNSAELCKAGSVKKKCHKGGNASALSIDEIQKYFDMPISTAAKKMNVGLTVLKKRCRELNITRWPHRKIMSLNSLIQNVKELGLEKELQELEDHKTKVEKMPDVELTDAIKKLRQACFKAKYKRRMQTRAAGCLPEIK